MPMQLPAGWSLTHILSPTGKSNRNVSTKLCCYLLFFSCLIEVSVDGASAISHWAEIAIVNQRLQLS